MKQEVANWFLCNIITTALGQVSSVFEAISTGMIDSRSKVSTPTCKSHKNKENEIIKAQHQRQTSLRRSYVAGREGANNPIYEQRRLFSLK